MQKITQQQVSEVAKQNGLEYASLQAFREVESGSVGFSQATGRLIIQFEPHHFKKYAAKEYLEYLRIKKLVDNKLSRSPAEFSLYSNWEQILSNKVSGQTEEWRIFNLAFAINKDAAMLSTSIGMGQIMGFHFKALGYKSVGEMWDDAKRGEYQQLLQMVRFIKSIPALYKALQTKNWHLVATYYNGAGYLALAKKIGREPYNISLQKAYNKFLK